MIVNLDFKAGHEDTFILNEEYIFDRGAVWAVPLLQVRYFNHWAFVAEGRSKKKENGKGGL